MLLLVMHHIISDGWSMSVLFDELAVAYRAYCRDESPQRPALPVQYADYALWQREWLSGAELERQAALLARAARRTRRRCCSCRPTVRGLPFRLIAAHACRAGFPRRSRQRIARTRSPRKAARCSWYCWPRSILSSAAVRASRMSSSARRSPGAGRTELEGLIGFFVNTLVLRTDLAGNPGFRELLARVKRVALEAYAHQDLPFEKLVDELNPERNPGCTPVFQVMFNLHNEPALDLDLDGLVVDPFGIDRGTSKFDLSVGLDRIRRGLVRELRIQRRPV